MKTFVPLHEMYLKRNRLLIVCRAVTGADNTQEGEIVFTSTC